MEKFKHWLNAYFEVPARGSTIGTEVLAGITTFAALSYVLVVNPMILEQAGMDRPSLITATALSALIGTLIMALWANLPVALAAGMGSNFIFAFVVVGQAGVSWQTALAMVFITGVIFVVLSLSRWREQIIKGFPSEIQLGLQCAIGIFIAYIGLRSGGLVTSSEASLIAFGDIRQPHVLLTAIGLIATPILLVKRIPGAFLLSIGLITLAGLFIPGADGKPLTKLPERLLAIPQLQSEMLWAFDFGEFFDNFFLLLPIALYFFMADFFSTAATLIGVTRRGNLLTPDGSVPNARAAFTADAVATVVGSAMGTSTVTSYIESVTGIETGGRTGLTGLVVGFFFLLAMFFWPLFTIIPAQAVTPSLVLVGVLMLEGFTDMKSETPEQTMTPLITLLMTACTADLMIGLASGCLTFTVIVAARRAWHRLTPMLIVLDISLLIYVALSARIAG